MKRREMPPGKTDTKRTAAALPPAGEHGFTLLEILVALAILGIAVTVVFQLFSIDLKAVRQSEDYVSAVVKAQSRMMEILDDEQLAETARSETTDEGYRMDITVSHVLQGRTEALPVRLLEVVLTIYWKTELREKSLTLRTMKMMPRKI